MPIQIAHVDPVFIFTWLGCLILSFMVGVAALFASICSRRQRRWTLIAGALVIPIGAWVTWVAYNDGARLDWILAACVAPILFGIITLIRYRFVKHETHVA